MDANIILVGMPASGKTTIGQLLSEKLDSYTFIDTDSFIEKTFERLKNARMYILNEVMLKAIPAPRAEISKYGY